MIDIFTNEGCTHCIRAKVLLKQANLQYTEHKNYPHEDLKAMFPTARTFPIVTINGQYIGGVTELERQIIENRDNLGKTLLQESRPTLIGY